MFNYDPLRRSSVEVRGLFLFVEETVLPQVFGDFRMHEDIGVILVLLALEEDSLGGEFGDDGLVDFA